MEVDIKQRTYDTHGDIFVRAKTHGILYVIVNMVLISSLQDFFTAEDPEGEDNIDLSYYGNLARGQAIDLMSQGAEFMNQQSKVENEKETMQDEVETKYQRLDLDIDYSIPVIFIPETILGDEDNEVIVLNLGRMTVTSNLIDYNPKSINYMEVKEHADLYDMYKIHFKGFHLTMIKKLDNYLQWKQAKQGIDIIEKIHLLLQMERCLEPKHLDFPATILFCNIEEIKIFFSDYIMVNVLQVQDYITTALNGKTNQKDILAVLEKNNLQMKNNKVDIDYSNNLDYDEEGEEDEEDEEEDDDEDGGSNIKSYSAFKSSSEESPSRSYRGEEASPSNVVLKKFTRDLAGSENREEKNKSFDSSSYSKENYEGGRNDSEYSSSESQSNENEESKLISDSYTGESKQVNSSTISYLDSDGTPGDADHSQTETPSSQVQDSQTIEDESKYTSESREYTDSGTSEDGTSKVHVKGSRNRRLSDPNYPSKVGYAKPQEVYSSSQMVNSKAMVDIGKDMNSRLYSVNSDSEAIDLKILIKFEKIQIVVGELEFNERVTDAVFGSIIKKGRRKIKHINIFELILTDLIFEMNQSVDSNDMDISIDRIFLKDLQKKKENNEMLIPEPYNMILCNPDIEELLGEDDESVYSHQENIKQLTCSVRMDGSHTEVKFLITNLRLIVTAPTLEKLTKFSWKMQELQISIEDREIQKAEEIRKHKKKMEDKKLQRAASEDDMLRSKGSGIPSPKLRSRSKSYVEVQTPKTVLPKVEKDKQGKSILQLVADRRIESRIGDEEPEYETEEISVTMAIEGLIQNIDLWIPLDAKDQDSRVLSLSFVIPIIFRMSDDALKITEVESKIVTSNEIKRQVQDGTIQVKNITMIMINRHLEDAKDEDKIEKLLHPFDIHCTIDNMNLPINHTNVMNINVSVDPIDLTIGFREVDNFKDISDVFSKIVEKMNYVEEAIENYDNYQDQIAKQRARQLLADYRRQKESDQSKATRIPLTYIKHKQIDLLRGTISVDRLNISLMDDTGVQEHPLVNFCISRIYTCFSQESGPDDAVAFILKKMGIFKYPYLKVDADLALYANYFNLDNGAFEPLIEPWEIFAKVYQKDQSATMKVMVNSDKLLNLNVTHGLALVIKLILARMSESKDDWVDENLLQDKNRMKSMKTMRKLSGSPLKAIASHMIEVKQEKENIKENDTQGFFFENNLGVPLRATLENYDVYTKKGINFEDRPHYHKDAVVDFSVNENEEGIYFRKLETLKSINKYVMKKRSKGKMTKNIEEPMIRMDLYIPGMEPVLNVPIQVAGLRSYELKIKEKSKKENHESDFVVIVDISQMGVKKMVSFESQVIITNKTYIDIQIAYVLTNDENEGDDELLSNEIEQAYEISKKENEERSVENKLEFEDNFKYDDLILFDEVTKNEEYRVPLKWMLKKVAIYYRTDICGEYMYRILIPDVKKVKKYDKLPKYYFLDKLGQQITFFSMEATKNKCKPSSLKMPSQINCVIRPPFSLRNMLFNELVIRRVADQQEYRYIESGDSASIFEAPYDIIHSMKNKVN